MHTEDLALRFIEPADAAQAAELSGQLGYPISISTMAENIAHLQTTSERKVFVAADANGFLAGWIGVAIVRHLQSAPFGEISGLIVAENQRSSGVGAILLRKAEEWFREQGMDTAVVRSRTRRTNAHRFYLREGFEELKTSLVFTKKL